MQIDRFSVPVWLLRKYCVRVVWRASFFDLLEFPVRFRLQIIGERIRAVGNDCRFTAAFFQDLEFTGKLTIEPINLVSDGLMTVKEAATFLRLSRSTVYSMMDDGNLPFVKLGRSRRIPRRAIVKLAAGELRGGSKFR